MSSALGASGTVPPPDRASPSPLGLSPWGVVGHCICVFFLLSCTSSPSAPVPCGPQPDTGLCGSSASLSLAHTLPSPPAPHGPLPPEHAVSQLSKETAWPGLPLRWASRDRGGWCRTQKEAMGVPKANSSHIATEALRDTTVVTARRPSEQLAHRAEQDQGRPSASSLRGPQRGCGSTPWAHTPGDGHDQGPCMSRVLAHCHKHYPLSLTVPGW